LEHRILCALMHVEPHRLALFPAVIPSHTICSVLQVLHKTNCQHETDAGTHTPQHSSVPSVLLTFGSKKIAILSPQLEGVDNAPSGRPVRDSAGFG
jgi:hypothetical protein